MNIMNIEDQNSFPFSNFCLIAHVIIYISINVRQKDLNLLNSKREKEEFPKKASEYLDTFYGK